MDKSTERKLLIEIVRQSREPKYVGTLAKFIEAIQGGREEFAKAEGGRDGE
jgi:hypothetical protein